MRIIAGTHRGRPILPPEDDTTTRPIIDRVKESLFNRLMALGMLEGPREGAEPWRCADVFAGTGSLGLEALSRGADHCTFVERDRDASLRLRENLHAFAMAPRATVVTTSAFAMGWLAGLRPDSLRIAFLDPPYAMMKDARDREHLQALLAELHPRLEPGGIVVLRTHEDDPPLDADPAAYDGPMSFTYGTMTLHFYQRPLPAEDGNDPGPDAGDPDERPPSDG